MSDRDALVEVVNAARWKWMSMRRHDPATTEDRLITDAVIAAGWRPPVPADHPTEPSGWVQVEESQAVLDIPTRDEAAEPLRVEPTTERQARYDDGEWSRTVDPATEVWVGAAEKRGMLRAEQIARQAVDVDGSALDDDTDYDAAHAGATLAADQIHDAVMQAWHPVHDVSEHRPRTRDQYETDQGNES